MESEKTLDVIVSELIKLNDKHNLLSQTVIVHSSNIDYLKLAIENINNNVDKLSKVFTDTNGNPSFSSRLYTIESDFDELKTNLKEKEHDRKLTTEAKITIWISIGLGVLGIISTIYATLHHPTLL